MNWLSSTSFLLVHALCLLAIFTGVSHTALVLLAVTFFVRSFFVTAGYHRYFSHRSFRTSRAFQAVLAFGAESSAQKGVLWWAAHHRHHHRFADTDRDLHSPQRGFWWSHVGWILCDRYGETEVGAIRDFARYPELRFLNRYDWIAPWTLGLVCWLIGGWSGLVVGFFWSTVLLWHTTFSINSLAHVFGRRRYDTSDTSRNSLSLALLTGGEGWHNNHHRCPASTRQGFFWWEIDTTYYVLRLLALLGVVRDVKGPPASVRSSVGG
ncbi:MAG: acyl-CoA desaturase [Actinobacteria bacterium]|nr:acyl-CoA desaturase [Actinomycetota bacterium]